MRPMGQFCVNLARQTHILDSRSTKGPSGQADQASLMRGVAWGKGGGAPQLMAPQEPCQL